MEHIAIDLGGRESQICVRNEQGEIVEERRVATSALKAWLRGRGKGRVVVETCAEGFAVADAARESKHEVRVVPGTLVRSLGVGRRGVKTDKRDAQVLSEVSCRIDLPSVHVPSSESRAQKSMLGMRDALVRSRTMLINGVRGWLRTQIKSPRTGSTKTFAQRVRTLWEQKSATPLPSFVERQLVMVDQVTDQIEMANAEVAEKAEADPVCVRLMTVPGIGPVASLRYRSTLDESERFENAHRVGSYLGLTPGEDSSSDRQRRTSITKAGSSSMRWVLLQSAWTAMRTRPKDPMVSWANEVAKRRGRRVAVTALARKMAGILYAIWRDGSVYEPTRGARATPPSANE